VHSSYPFAKARLRNLANIINIKRPKEGASVLFKKVFPPKDIIALRYPVSISSPKIILYYMSYLRCRSFLYKREAVGGYGT
jgi:hypothetical protein